MIAEWPEIKAFARRAVEALEALPKPVEPKWLQVDDGWVRVDQIIGVYTRKRLTYSFKGNFERLKADGEVWDVKIKVLDMTKGLLLQVCETEEHASATVAKIIHTLANSAQDG